MRVEYIALLVLAVVVVVDQLAVAHQAAPVPTAAPKPAAKSDESLLQDLADGLTAGGELVADNASGIAAVLAFL